MKKFRIGLGVLVAAAFVMISPATASADEVRDYQVDGASIRSEPNGYSEVIGMGYIGDGVTIYCATYGPAGNYNGDAFWIKSRNHRTGVVGWSSGAVIGGVINRLPRC